MNDEMGDKKAEGWRKSGKIAYRKDSVTGSDDEDCIEWAIRVDWERMTSEDWNAMTIQTNQDATQADVDVVLDAGRSMSEHIAEAGGKASSSSAGELVQVKLEKKTAQEIVDEKCEVLKANLPANISKMNDLKLSVNQIKADAGMCTSIIAKTVHNEATSLVPKIETVVVTLEGMLTRVAKDGKIPKLVASIEQLEHEGQELSEWATSLNITKKVAKGKKRK